jgi:hypothetical protein
MLPRARREKCPTRSRLARARDGPHTNSLPRAWRALQPKPSSGEPRGPGWLRVDLGARNYAHAAVTLAAVAPADATRSGRRSVGRKEVANQLVALQWHVGQGSLRRLWSKQHKPQIGLVLSRIELPHAGRYGDERSAGGRMLQVEVWFFEARQGVDDRLGSVDRDPSLRLCQSAACSSDSESFAKPTATTARR